MTERYLVTSALPYANGSIHLGHLVEHAGLSDKIEIIQRRLEELSLAEPVDVIVSEPIGTFLLHERMIDSFVAARDKFLRPGFQISQRSDFFSELQSVDTMQRRPLVNTRDEPHANNERFRRFHVIIGDSNLSLFAGYLKIGTTCLMSMAR